MTFPRIVAYEMSSVDLPRWVHVGRKIVGLLQNGFRCSLTFVRDHFAVHKQPVAVDTSADLDDVRTRFTDGSVRLRYLILIESVDVKSNAKLLAAQSHWIIEPLHRRASRIHL